jgi:hypothetical protein
MAIGQAREPTQAHAVGETETLDMAGAYPILFRRREKVPGREKVPDTFCFFLSLLPHGVDDQP